jgi:hypothetical protein
VHKLACSVSCHADARVMMRLLEACWRCDGRCDGREVDCWSRGMLGPDGWTLAVAVAL